MKKKDGWEAHGSGKPTYDHCDIILLQMLYSANIIEVYWTRVKLSFDLQFLAKVIVGL